MHIDWVCGFFSNKLGMENTGKNGLKSENCYWFLIFLFSFLISFLFSSFSSFSSLSSFSSSSYVGCYGALPGSVW